MYSNNKITEGNLQQSYVKNLYQIHSLEVAPITKFIYYICHSRFFRWEGKASRKYV